MVDGYGLSSDSLNAIERRLRLYTAVEGRESLLHGHLDRFPTINYGSSRRACWLWI